MGYCKHSTELLGSIKSRKFLDQLMSVKFSGMMLALCGQVVDESKVTYYTP
jgi:hypothetical protein